MWLEERQKGIGASDSSSILGLNPYKTNIQLWKEKTGLIMPEDISNKNCVKYGTDAECFLRELFKLDYPEYAVMHNQYFLHKHKDYPFILATLDGELTDISTGEKGILEIKTTQTIKSRRDNLLSSNIPNNYYIQCLHQLLATGWSFVVLKVQSTATTDGEKHVTTTHHKILRSEVLEDIGYLQIQLIKFWGYVTNGIEPPLILPPI